MGIDVTLSGGAGEYMESATLIEWHAKAGERVEAGALLAVVETAKAATEIEAPASGILVGPLAEVGSEIAVGTVLGRIAAAGEEPGAEAGVPEPPAAAAPPVPPPAGPATTRDGGRVVASPLARRLARQRGLDLSGIRGSGPRGRIRSRDLPEAPPAAAVATAPPPRPKEPVSGPAGGAAPLLVMLHGFGANRLTWSGLVPRLGGAIRCLALDLPGHGRNASPAAGLDAIASELSARIAQEGASAVHLVGHSLGGAVAARIAATGRLPLASLTLIAPAGLGAEIDGAFLAGFLRAKEPASLSPWLDRLVVDPSVLPGGFAAAVLEERVEAGHAPLQERIAAALFPDGTQAIDVRADLRSLPVPVKVLWGACDAILPPSHAMRLPGTVALHRLDGIGHMPHLEAPDLVARLVLEAVRAGAFALS